MAKPVTIRKPHKVPETDLSSPTAVPLQGRAYVPLDQIEAVSIRTRDLNEKHVVALAESIAAIGLIHPPAVDRFNRLLAGAHRIAALRWLRGHAGERFRDLFPEGVPVWRMDLNSDSDVDLALAVEISENEQRRDYSNSEIQRLAERLKAAGFHYSAEGGRPRSGDRPLMPALEIIVGKSVRQLRRVLGPSSAKGRIPPRETRSHDLVFDLQRFLDASEQIVSRLGPAAGIPELFSLKAQLERVNRLTVVALKALKPSTN